MPLTSEEQRELDELELKALEAKASAASTNAPVSVGSGELDAAPTAYPPLVPAPTPTRMPVKPTALSAFLDAGSMGAFSAGRQAAQDKRTGVSPSPNAGFGSLMLPVPPRIPKQGEDLAVDVGLESGGAVAGQVAGAATGPLAPVAVPVLGGIGGAAGNYGAQRRQMAAGDKKDLSIGEMVAAFIGGMVPGASLAKAGVKTVAKEAGKNAASNVTAKAAETYLEEGRLPNPHELALAAGGAAAGTGVAKAIDKGLNSVAIAAAVKKAQDITRRETLAAGRELGYVLPPSLIRPNMANDSLNSLGGKAATAQEAVKRNQPITNQAIRAELNLPPADLSTGGKGAISVGEINAAKAGPFAVYKEISGVTPQSKIMLEQFQDATSEARKLRAAYRNSATHDRSLLDGAKQFEKEAAAYLKLLDAELAAAQRADLIAPLGEAKIKLAKIGLVEDARNKGTGDIDATVIGKAFDRGEPLTGNLEKIGRFQNAFSQMVKDQAMSPPSGVHQLLPLLGGSTAAYMGFERGPQAAAATIAAFMAAPQAARALALSKPYQRAFVNYGYGPTRQDLSAMIGRMASQVASRQVNPQAFQQQMPAPPIAFINRP